MFDTDSCTECGVCLTQCPTVQYTSEKAIAEIRALKQGDNADILSVCITCMACNEYCPNEADPFDLISRLQERYGVRVAVRGRAEMIEAMLDSVPKRIVVGDTALPAAVALCHGTCAAAEYGRQPAL